MTNFTPKKIDLSQINGGKRYENGSGVTPNTFNDPIEATAWVQKLAENQPTVENNGGAPSVFIEEQADGTPKFKFLNLNSLNEQRVNEIVESKGYQPKIDNLETNYQAVVSEVNELNEKTNKNSNKIKGIYSGLVQTNIYGIAENAQLTEETQVTGGSELDGLTIVDGSIANVKKISGDTAVNSATNKLRHFNIDGIKSAGRNLLDISKFVGRALVDNYDGTYTLSTDGANNRFSATVDIIGDFPTNTTLYLQMETISSNLEDGTGENQNIYFAFIRFGSDSNFTNYQLSYFFISGNEANVNMPNFKMTKAQIYLSHRCPNGNYITFKNPKICLVPNLPYEPYTENTMQLPQTIELGKWDYIQDGKLVKGTQDIAIKKLTSSFMRYQESGNAYYGSVVLNNANYGTQDYGVGTETRNIISTVFNAGRMTEGGTEGIYVTGEDMDIIIIWFNADKYPEFSDINKVNKYIASLDLKVAYELAKPKIIDLNIDDTYQVWNNGQETILSPEDENGINSFDTKVSQDIELGNIGYDESWGEPVWYADENVYFDTPTHIRGSLTFTQSNLGTTKTYNIDTDWENQISVDGITFGLYYRPQSNFSSICVADAYDSNGNLLIISDVLLVISTQIEIPALHPVVENDYYILVGGDEE